ncbi:Wzz/FepE/Etk N-terminal domain-containing protein, partial [Pseudomonas sp. SIMBA_059]
LFATPIYSADALVQVEQKNASTVLNEIDSILPPTPASDTEIEILESRMVIGKTVDDLGLDTVVEQNYFPVIGKGLSRLMGNKP